MRALRLPVHRPSGLWFVSLPRRYRGARRCSLLRRPRAAHHRPGPSLSPAGLTPRLLLTECMGSPRFLGNPRTLAPLSDPGEASRARPVSARRCCRRLLNSVGPAQLVFSRLYHAALVLAVYASRPGLLQDSRKTRFRLVASLCRAGLFPAGLLREVSMSRAVRYISPSPRLRLARSE